MSVIYIMGNNGLWTNQVNKDIRNGYSTWVNPVGKNVYIRDSSGNWKICDNSASSGNGGGQGGQGSQIV